MTESFLESYKRQVPEKKPIYRNGLRPSNNNNPRFFSGLRWSKLFIEMVYDLSKTIDNKNTFFDGSGRATRSKIRPMTIPKTIKCLYLPAPVGPPVQRNGL